MLVLLMLLQIAPGTKVAAAGELHRRIVVRPRVVAELLAAIRKTSMIRKEFGYVDVRNDVLTLSSLPFGS